MSTRDEQSTPDVYRAITIPWDRPVDLPPFYYLNDNYRALDAAPPRRGIRTPFLWPPRATP